MAKKDVSLLNKVPSQAMLLRWTCILVSVDRSHRRGHAIQSVFYCKQPTCHFACSILATRPPHICYVLQVSQASGGFEAAVQFMFEKQIGVAVSASIEEKLP
jgi:hypothetical protein